MNTDRRQVSDNWVDTLEKLANQSSLAVVLLDEQRTLFAANDNSICAELYSSGSFSSQCQKYCGSAQAKSHAEKQTISIRCHAGLHFNAIPLTGNEGQKLVIIAGRTFIAAEDYRTATKRAMEGDWQVFEPQKLFQNILLKSSENEIDRLTKKLEKLTVEEKNLIFQFKQKLQNRNADEDKLDEQKSAKKENISEIVSEFQSQQTLLQETRDQQTIESRRAEARLWRSFFGSLLDLSYESAIQAVAGFLQHNYQITELAWLENHGEVLQRVWATGNLKEQEIQIGIATNDSRFTEVVENETSLELREKSEDDQTETNQQIAHLFPIFVAGTIHSAILIGEDLPQQQIKKQISRFIKQLASQIEILRLREEVKQQSWVSGAVKKLNQTFKDIDKEDFWSVLAQNAAELMNAERASILFYEEKSEKFRVRAAIGERAEFVKNESPETLGERISVQVVQSGKPLIIDDIKKTSLMPAPKEWNYKTDSFISFPILMGGRKIGVLNVADKVDGGIYKQKDLDLLQMLAPQIALAIDHTDVTRKAGEFEQLSITDPLTGLVNRRYLEERMTEEISRSQRHGYPMSFMMIDVDSFKSYNDSYGHLEGDKALQIVGQCLKSTLRGADVAARFGGEEFSILLPQTSLSEATAIAERLRQRVEETAFPNRQVTVSVGVAACSAELNSVALIMQAADYALYQAKEKGRNNVQIYVKATADEAAV